MMKLRSALAVLLLLGSVLLAVTCNPYGFGCEEATACLDGNDMDYDACIEEANTYEQLAALHRCEEEWESYLTCIDKHPDCDGSGNSKTFASKCSDERSDFLKCID